MCERNILCFCHFMKLTKHEIEAVRDLITQSMQRSAKEFSCLNIPNSTWDFSRCHIMSYHLITLFPIASLVFAEEYPLGCWEMQQNPSGESEAWELAAIKDCQMARHGGQCSTMFAALCCFLMGKGKWVKENSTWRNIRNWNQAGSKMNENAYNVAVEELAQMAKFKVGASTCPRSMIPQFLASQS